MDNLIYYHISIFDDKVSVNSSVHDSISDVVNKVLISDIVREATHTLYKTGTYLCHRLTLKQ